MTDDGSQHHAIDIFREEAAWLRKAGEFMIKKADVIDQAVAAVVEAQLRPAEMPRQHEPDHVVDPCTGCMGSGSWIGMPCMRCIGKGWQSRDDVMRNANYDAVRRTV